MNSFQNLIVLQNLYRLKSMGFEYVEHINVNEHIMHNHATTLKELALNINTCHLCDLSKSRTQSMSGFGNTNAELLIVDFSVSKTQDEANAYYSGRTGEILQKMIENVVGLDIKDIFSTHSVKCKTLNSNIPSLSECNSCKSYLLAQIELIQPKIIVTLGEDAYKNLTGNNDSFENVRGHIVDFKETKLIPIYHPSYLLRNPNLKKTTYNDLQNIKRYL